MMPVGPPAGADPVAATFWRRTAPRFLAGLALAVVVVSALALFGDARELVGALHAFDWSLAVPILGLTIFNYALRFAKWQLYLRALDVPPIPTASSALVFLAGFSMAITPGKVGELIKAVLLRRLTGASVGRGSAIVAAERITDGLAMLVLAGIGLVEFAYGRVLLGLALFGTLLLVAVLRRPQLARTVLGRVEHRQVIRRGIAQALAFVDAADRLLRPRLLVAAVVLGVISWGAECAAFYLILVGLDLPPSWHLLLVATFVLAVSSILGALSMLPGGLGVADASVAGMLLLLVADEAMTRSLAVAATLLVRFATLWFAVALGVIALAVFRARTSGEGHGKVEQMVEPG